MARKVLREGGQKTALIYCRVSTRTQGREGTSLETQAKACIKHAESLGYKVGRVTKEIFSGAELWDRPQLTRDRADMKAGEFQALICYSTDRLSRNPLHLAIVADDCERAGADLVFVTEPLDNSAEGQLIQYVKGYAAHIEREKIKERTLRARVAKLQGGKPAFGGWTIYGYRPNREAACYEIVESEALVVRQVFEMCASGIGCHAMASRLNRVEVPSPKVNFRGPTAKWSASTLYMILKNPAYKGEEYQWRTKKDKKKRDRPRPESEWIKLPAGTRPAIVSADLWDSAQAGLKARSGTATRNESKPVLLRGLLFCGECGSRMIRNRFQRGKYVYEKYRCGSHWRPFKTACTGKGIPVADCNQWVWEKVKSVFLDPSIIRAELKRLQETAPDAETQTRLLALRRERDRSDAGIRALLSRFRKSLDDPTIGPAIEREVKAAGKEKQHIESEIARLENRISTHARAVVDVTHLENYCGQIARKLERLPFKERRLALEVLGVRVHGNGDKDEGWELEMSVPLESKGDVIPLRASANVEYNYITLRFNSKKAA